MADSTEHQFDRWTRRRFGGAAGLAVGLTLSGVGFELADAKKRHKKKKKKHKKDEGCEYFECIDEGETCFTGASPCCACRECRRYIGDQFTCQDPDD